MKVYEHRVKSYRGYRLADGEPVVEVILDGDIPDSYILTPEHSLGIVNHSPTGFEWGYKGSGPSQLALAILCDFLQNDNKALEFYHEFKWRIVAKLPDNKWEITAQQINDTLGEIDEDYVRMQNQD